jgi:cysteine desulfurase family protein
MNGVYLDNAATSYPKAPGVSDAVKRCLDEVGGSVHRSGLGSLPAADELVWETREKLASLFNFPHAENVVFTMNVTQALNFLLKGLLRPGDHVLVSSLEHNAVMRPLVQLERQGVTYSRIWADREGHLSADLFRDQIKSSTRLVVVTHASNVCGTLLPVEEIGVLCEQYGLIFILDTAQTAGAVDIDFQKTKAHAIAFTGHKGLLGPQGIGGFVLRSELAERMEPLISGGTGSMSESEEVPPYLPDKFEAGTMNLPAVCGLHAALEYLEKTGLEAIRTKELALTQILLAGLAEIEGVRVVGPSSIQGRAAVISVDFPGRDNGEIAYRLEKDFGIVTRCGLHCSPAAHQTLGTFPKGTVRFSPGHFNTEEEMRAVLTAVHRILAETPPAPE